MKHTEKHSKRVNVDTVSDDIYVKCRTHKHKNVKILKHCYLKYFC